MVKILSLFLLLANILFADILQERIKSLVSEETYDKHYKLIQKLFHNKEQFLITENRVDILKVIKTLKENGLLNLFFSTPKKNFITFKTNGSPLFFMKLIEDNLRALGYSLVYTQSVNCEEAFEWSIYFVSEYTLDPEIFTRFLEKNGCKVVDIKRFDETNWEYFINIDNAFLNVKKLSLKKSVRLKRALHDYWLNVDGGTKISIASYGGNKWYPKISVYDKNLHLLKVYKKEEKTDWLVFYLPVGAYYIKISDSYTLNNLKYGLKVTLE